MGIYINTTTTVTRRINYFYRCSKCGAVIGQSAFVSGAAKYNKYNGETAANNAYSRANADSNSAVTKALKKAAQGDYRPMRIRRNVRNANIENHGKKCGYQLLSY